MHKPMTFFAISMALFLVMTGCRGPRILRDGFTLGETQWSKDENELRTRAAFELSCAKDSLTLQVLSEEYDVAGKRQMGNTPQALSHLALVGAADALASVTRGEHGAGEPAL